MSSSKQNLLEYSNVILKKFGTSNTGNLRKAFPSTPQYNDYKDIAAKTLYIDLLNRISSWANKLTEVGVSVVALGVVLEVLFKGANIPFWPDVSVVENIMGILGSLSNEGLLGLVGAFVLYWILKNKA